MKTISLILFKFLVFTLLTLLPSFLHAADPPGWKDLGLYGGQMYALAIDPMNANIMFAGSYQGDGLFKSTDGGVTWESVNGFRNLTAYSIAFDPANHTTVWVATTAYVYKTGDGGTTWARLDPATQAGMGLYYYYSVAIDTRERNTVYIGTSGPNGTNDGGKVLKTTDGGATWQALSLEADHNVWSLAVNPLNSREVWAITGPSWVTSGSIFRTTDGGATWSKIVTGTTDGWFWSIVVNPREPAVIYVAGEKGILRTRDGGATWAYLEPRGWCRGIALDPQNPTTIYVNCLGDDDTLFARTADGGDTWTYQRGFPLEFLCLSVSPANSQTVFGGDSSLGVFRTTDGGETWGRASKGVRANRIMDSAVSPGGTLLVGSYSGVHLKKAGEEWQLLNFAPGRAVAFSPDTENIIYAGFDYGFGKSSDSGENWEVVYIPSNDLNRVSSIAINPHNPDILYVGVAYSSGAKGEIYKSTDGGRTIRPVKTLEVPVNALKVNPVNPEVVYAGSGLFFAPGAAGGIYKSTDGGETWAMIKPDLVVNALALDASNPDMVYAGCGTSAGFYGGIFRSVDGGVTWQERDFGIPVDSGITDLGIDPVSSSIVYAASARHGLFLTFDEGNYWTVLGLSDYWLYDLTVGPSGTGTRSGKSGNVRTALPSSGLTSGSGSGMLEFTGAGIGVVTGMLSDAEKGTRITGGTVSTDTGGIALSLEGAYVMVNPSGVFTVTGTMQGYQPFSRPGVTVTSGGETTVDIGLAPLCSLNVTAISTNLTTPPTVGQSTQFTFTAVGRESARYYRYWVASGYQSTDYGHWQLLRDWSSDPSLTWAPAADGHYVLVAWVADDPSHEIFQQAGLSVETRGNSSHPVVIRELTTDMSFPQSSGTAVTLTTKAGGGNGPLLYRYWYQKEGGSWQMIRDYASSNSCTWTPPEDGGYTVVVWVTDDPGEAEPSIIGMTCTIGDAALRQEIPSHR